MLRYRLTTDFMASKPLFHPSLYRYDEPQPSYWEDTARDLNPSGDKLNTTESCDVAIIGGGYTGLSAALHLARDYQIDVRVLEAGHIGWGASGRNGGFCTMPSTKISLKSQIRKFGLEETRKYHASQVEGVELVRQLGETESIDFLAQGDGQVTVADSHKAFSGLVEYAEFQKKILNVDIDIYSQDEFKAFGYDSSHQHGAINTKPAFGLHPLRYVKGLAIAAEKHGVKLHPHSKVDSWRKENGRHHLVTDEGTLTAKQVILTGNGFLPENLNNEIAGRHLPLQSAIVVTRPLKQEELDAQHWKTETPLANSAHMFFYYRLLKDRRLLLGGRANHIGDPGGAEVTWQFLEDTISNLWPHFSAADITHRWRGLVCFAMNLRPSLGRMQDDQSIWYSFGYHGNGVASATWHGKALAKWMGELSHHNSPSHIPALIQGLPPRFPIASMRPQYLSAALNLYKLRDKFEL